MGIYLNPGYAGLEIDMNDEFYVDKSMIISKLNSLVGTKNCFVCVSRPRRFGKTMATNLLAAYYSKASDSHSIFSQLKISSDPSFERHINRYNVIKIDVNGAYETRDKGQSLVDAINRKVISEMREFFSDIDLREASNIANAIEEVYRKKGEKFIIILDEYDVLVRMEVPNNELEEYISFLNGLFKNSNIAPAIALAYLTGILPIVREKVQSKLNNFAEYTMVDASDLSEFVGFTEEEVKTLANKHGIDFDELKRWYDGYDVSGYEIYSPKSVVTALNRKRCGDYWTATSSYDALRDYIMMNFEGLKDDVVSMISGESIPVNTKKYLNTMNDFRSKDDVFTYLIHLGYLAYNKKDSTCYIPNYEVRSEWINSIEDSVEYSNAIKLMRESRALLEATWNMDSNRVAKSVERTHMIVTSNLTYNNEGSFQSAIRLAYFYADSYYTVISELPAGKGYADVVFIPFVHDKPAIIIELKKGKPAATAINQIKNKNYPAILEKYKDNLLLVGISYNTETKEHSAVIERA